MAELSFLGFLKLANEYYGYCNTVTSFTDTKFPELLQKLGHTDLIVAKMHREDSKISSNPSVEEHGELYALVNAYNKFRTSADDKSIGSKVTDVINHFTFRNSQRRIQGYHKASEMAGLIGLWYEGKKNKELAKKYLGIAKECFELYVKARHDAATAYGDGSPGGGSRPVEISIREEDEKIKPEREEFLKLYAHF